jgi:putative transposase
LIDPNYSDISLRRQCELVGISRTGYYYQPVPESPQNLLMMRLLDQQYTRTPFYGTRRLTTYLNRLGYTINRKRVQRLMCKMGLEAIYPKPRTSQKHPQHRIYPYLLRGLSIDHPNQVWSTDITYVPMPQGFMYLVAVIDWHSRYVLSWRLSNTLEVDFCLDALEEAFIVNKPEIFNTDQGSQFTSPRSTNRLEDENIRVSMDGRGRALDNIFIERLWRSVKYEDLYIKAYDTVPELHKGLSDYFLFYN